MISPPFEQSHQNRYSRESIPNMFTIKRYTPADEKVWNQYVSCSRNGTFLFNRGYMDYHSDRFHDHSLLFYVGNKLHSLLPAHEREDWFCTHRGLTYGGLIMNMDVTVADVAQLFVELNDYLREKGFRHVLYKPVPWVYHQVPSEEDLYPLFWQCHARIASRDVGTAVVLQQHIRWRRLRRRSLRHAQEAGIVVQRSDDYASFWQVLTDNLRSNYGVSPVHTLAEIELLHSRFPREMVLYTATLEGRVVGGLLVYLSSQVVHAQYSSATPEGKELGAMDALYDYVMCHEYADYQYLDFGRSTEGDGSVLNASLVSQKEGFAGRTICYDTYEWDLD